MHFSDEDLQKLRGHLLEVRGKYERLLILYHTRAFKNEETREYAMQGFIRRLSVLNRCIHNVFQIFPLNQSRLPTEDERVDGVINLQAFVTNVFGIIDNIARIWILEKGLTKDDGSPIPNGWIGLRKTNTFVRKSFSPESQEYLVTRDPWFDLLENFRHALAHRIPLYIPPYNVTEDKQGLYNDLERRRMEAVVRHDFAEDRRLSAEQEELAVFIPLMTHSFVEEAKAVVFHAQIVADYLTVEELGRMILEELDR